jgi:farnesol dehydrogenase
VQLIHGDITDKESLARGIEGCSRVFHLAAYAKNWAPDPSTYDRLNLEATLNVFEVSRQFDVQRVVWTSTIMTLGPTPRGIVSDESQGRFVDQYLTEYERTKCRAEQEAQAWAADGFPVVIVNPTRVYGPGHLTEGNALARLIDDYDRGRVPVLLNRGVNVGNYVFVDDVVAGHILAMEKGRLGQRYILGGENASLKEFFRTIDRVTGRRHIQIPIWKFAPLVFAHLLEKRAEWWGAYPIITPGWMKTFLCDWAYSSDKARRELGYEVTSLEQGIRTTHEWLQQIRENRA